MNGRVAINGGLHAEAALSQKSVQNFVREVESGAFPTLQ